MNHWTEDDITQWLYGLRTDAAHLEACPACRAQVDAAQQRRRQVLCAPQVTADFLAAQRRTIYARLERPRSPFTSWLPLWNARWTASVAMALGLGILGVNLSRTPAPPSPSPLVNASDARLYSDLVAIDQSAEPRAIRPIKSLFEE